MNFIIVMSVGMTLVPVVTMADTTCGKSIHGIRSTSAFIEHAIIASSCLQRY
jgi:hypothetical protein